MPSRVLVLRRPAERGQSCDGVPVCAASHTPDPSASSKLHCCAPLGTTFNHLACLAAAGPYHTPGCRSNAGHNSSANLTVSAWHALPAQGPHRLQRRPCHLASAAATAPAPEWRPGSLSPLCCAASPRRWRTCRQRDGAQPIRGPLQASPHKLLRRLDSLSPACYARVVLLWQRGTLCIRPAAFSKYASKVESHTQQRSKSMQRESLSAEG